MKHDLIGAELKIKVNAKYNCSEFYDYLLNNQDLLKQIRSSEKYIHIAKIPRTARMIIYGFNVLLFLVQFLSRIYLFSFVYFVNDYEINSNIEHIIIFIFSRIIYISNIT
jgi:hypothetical protein